MSEQYRKNIEKISDMVNDNHQRKIVVGNHSIKSSETRKVGDKWTDSDGVEWEQKEGYRSKVSKMPARGLFDAHCKDCESGLTKPWDLDVHKADGRCYYCQIEFEAELKSKYIQWFAYRRLKDLKNMDALHKDMETFVFEKHEFEKNETIFDDKVANALANNNIDTTNVKLKQQTS